MHLALTLIDRHLRRIFPKVSVEFSEGPTGWDRPMTIRTLVATHAQPDRVFSYSICVNCLETDYEALANHVAREVALEAMFG